MRQMTLKAAKLKVTGRVQRVGYRRYVLDLAQEEGVAGYVKNEKDGSVTVFAQGQQSKLGSFLKKVKSPPPPAVVKVADESSAKPNRKFKHFSAASGNLADELQEGFGAMQTEFRDYRDEFRDYRSEFRDYRSEFGGFAKRTDENFKSLDAKYGAISEKLGEILAALTEQAKKTQEMLESMRSEARQTAETLNESLRLLRDAVEKLPRAS